MEHAIKYRDGRRPDKADFIVRLVTPGGYVILGELKCGTPNPSEDRKQIRNYATLLGSDGIHVKLAFLLYFMDGQWRIEYVIGSGGYPPSLNPKPSTTNPKPSNLIPTPYTLHPTPYTISLGM